MPAKRVDVVFDAYPIPSIKESERACRGLDANKTGSLLSLDQNRVNQKALAIQ